MSGWREGQTYTHGSRLYGRLVDAADARLAKQPEPIINRMEDCGNGRHVGWWESHGIGAMHLFIEIQPETLLIACCEGKRGNRRRGFYTDRKTAVEIVLASAKALGLSISSPEGEAKR